MKAARLDPSPSRVQPGDVGASSRNAIEAALADLRSRLLLEALSEASSELLARMLRLAAIEAEAQAWLTPYPLLLFPALFQEKAFEASSYLDRQRRLRPVRTGGAIRSTLGSCPLWGDPPRLFAA